MWIGNGPFNNFGYQGIAYLKGTYEKLDPSVCYKIEDIGPPNSPDQYHVVPVDENDKPLGPAAIETAGQMMYTIWDNGQGTAYNISNAYIP